MNTQIQVPHNVEAEVAVLGSVFIDETVLVEVRDELIPDDFYDHRNKVIFKAILAINDEGLSIDMTSLIAYLERINQLQSIGGIDYLNSIINYNYSTYNISSYIELVREASLKRIAIARLQELTQKGFDSTIAANDYITNVEEAVFDLSKRRKTSTFVGISEATDIVKSKMAKNMERKGGIVGLSTGYKNLNDVTLGFQPEQLIILGARPAMGKSALAMNIAVNVASANKAKVAIFSLEMSLDQLVERMIAADGSLHVGSIKTGDLNGTQMRQFAASCDKLNKLDLYFDDSSVITIEDIRTKCRKLQASQGLDFVVIDYLQLIDGGKGNSSRQEQVSKISRGLKTMARELQIPVLALAQIARKAEDREDKKPLMADLRDSGSIEQDADVIMFIHREDYYRRGKKEEENQLSDSATLIISKNRSGTSGVELEFMFQGRYSKFVEVDKGDN